MANGGYIRLVSEMPIKAMQNNFAIFTAIQPTKGQIMHTQPSRIPYGDALVFNLNVLMDNVVIGIIRKGEPFFPELLKVTGLQEEICTKLMGQGDGMQHNGKTYSLKKI